MGLLLAVALLWPSAARADAGVPMLVFVWPASWGLLVPIVLGEACLARRVLGLRFGRAVSVAGAANLVSTFVGIPLTWGLALAFELGVAALFNGESFSIYESGVVQGVVAAAWLGPEAKFWLVLFAAMVLCVPFFLVSVWTERLVAKRMEPGLDAGTLKRWAWLANAASYGLIVLGLAVGLVFALVKGL